MLDWWLPENVSTYGRDIDWLFHLIYAITGVTLVHVSVALVAFLIIYRDRPGRRARYTHGNSTLEIVWTVVPALILIILTFLSVPAWSKIKMSQPPSDFVVSVTAKQFNWQVKYANSDKVFLDEMHVPVNKVVHVDLKSQDVIHSFFVPQFRIKQDAVPGMKIQMWFQPTQTGTFELGCAELCGLGHYRMRAVVTVHTQQDYDRWVAEHKSSVATR
jgi:cytochrome c oxidase subunit 2